jgi:hypothetical protein
MPEEPILPMRRLLRELCPDAFARIEEQLANPEGGGQAIRKVGEEMIDGEMYETLETYGPAFRVFAGPRTFSRLAVALDAQLASGAVDRWLREHPDEAITREQVVEHLAYLQEDRGEAPKPGSQIIWYYELPLPARH